MKGEVKELKKGEVKGEVKELKKGEVKGEVKEFNILKTFCPGGLEPQLIKLEFIIYLPKLKVLPNIKISFNCPTLPNSFNCPT